MKKDYIKGNKYDIFPKVIVQNFTQDKNTNYAINTREDGEGGTGIIRTNGCRENESIGEGKDEDRKTKRTDNRRTKKTVRIKISKDKGRK
jgi:hypothetical protein